MITDFFATKKRKEEDKTKTKKKKKKKKKGHEKGNDDDDDDGKSMAQEGRKELLIDSRIVGRQFADHAALESLRDTDAAHVELVREPYNAYDKNAIQCVVGGRVAGHLPAALVKWIAPLVDARAAEASGKIECEEVARARTSGNASSVRLTVCISMKMPRCREINAIAVTKLMAEVEKARRKRKREQNAVAKSKRKTAGHASILRAFQRQAAPDPRCGRASEHARALSAHLLQEIFVCGGFTVHDFLVARLVCKDWQLAIDDDDFLKHFFMYQKFLIAGAKPQLALRGHGIAALVSSTEQIWAKRQQASRMEVSEMNAFIDTHLGAGAARLATELATNAMEQPLLRPRPMTILAIALIYIA
eukprot:g3411.t1